MRFEEKSLFVCVEMKSAAMEHKRAHALLMLQDVVGREERKPRQRKRSCLA